MKLVLTIIDKYTPVKKLTVRTVKAPWIDEELKNCMAERDGPKGVTNKSGYTSDWLTYSKFRNYVTKLNKQKNTLCYEAKINDIKNVGKQLWNTLNKIMRRKTNSTPSFIESDGLVITKPFDVANYFYNYFIGKVGKLRQEMPTTNSEQLYSCMKKRIMKEKQCKFEFC